MKGKDLIRTGRFLSLVLRHEPSAAELELDANGWANVSDLLGFLQKKQAFTLEDLMTIVATDNKQRFAFNQDMSKIRANQGHSISVDLELPTSEPPEKLYHGTATKYLNKIYVEGLQSMNRQFVHLSNDIETAITVAKRHGKPYIFEIEAKRMYDDGYTFYLSQNNVWLTDNVPTRYMRPIITINQ